MFAFVKFCSCILEGVNVYLKINKNFNVILLLKVGVFFVKDMVFFVIKLVVKIVFLR